MLLWSKSAGMMMVAYLAACCSVSQAEVVPALGVASRRAAPCRPAGCGSSEQPSLSERLLGIRGGAKRRTRKNGGRTAGLSSRLSSEQKKTATGRKKVGAAAEKKKSAVIGDTVKKYKAILPLTRLYITLVGLVTLLGVVLGEDLAQGLLALDPIRTLYGMELWRPITAACFLGPPSVGWLMSAYYLFQYGSSLERAYGTAQYLIFLLGQVALLSVLAVLLGQPFFAPSVITAMLHVLSRSMPKQQVKWLIFNVPYWSLPYGLMASDVLQAQSPMAAVPHIMGILTGHFYFFHKFVWPRMGGEDWLSAPDMLVHRLDPNARDDDDGARKSVSNALNKRKKGKGRKLGGK